MMALRNAKIEKVKFQAGPLARFIKIVKSFFHQGHFIIKHDYADKFLTSIPAPFNEALNYF